MLTPEVIPEPMFLRIAAKAEIARGIYRFDLVHSHGLELPTFTPGAHISLRSPKGHVRKYSLCNDPDERDHYVLAIKREADGEGGSISLVDDTKVGDEIGVGEPRNDFPLVANATSFLFVAGGIGITPFISMMLHLKASGSQKFKLVYLSRYPETTAFRDELLGPTFRGQVEIHHTYGDPSKAYDLWPMLEKQSGRNLYCCGSRRLMEAVRDMSGHWSGAAVHFEDFGTNKPAHKADDTPFVIRLARSGRTIEVPAEVTILDALRAEGIRVSASCESGTCGSCRTKLLNGEADHRDLVLTEREFATDLMICVSRAKSRELVLDL